MEYGEVTDFKKVPAEWLDMPNTAKALTLAFIVLVVDIQCS